MNRGRRIGGKGVESGFVNFQDYDRYGDGLDEDEFTWTGGFDGDDEDLFDEAEYPRFQKMRGRGGRSALFDDGDGYRAPKKGGRRRYYRRAPLDEIWDA